MSCYGWEEGTFVLSVTAFRKLATDFYAAHNKLLAQDKATLERLRAGLIAEHKGKRGVDWSQAFELATEKTERFSTGYYGQATRKAYRLEVVDEWAAKRMLVESVDPETNKTVFHAPRALKASSFAPKSLRSDPAVHFEEAGVRFDRDARTVVWRVSENNHSCERAREHKLGQAFWKGLAAVEWTRGTGGSVVGNDEYNRDDRGHEGGANYTKDRFGPLGEPNAHRARRPSRGLSM